MDRGSSPKKSGQVSLAFGAAPAFAQSSANSANGIFVRTPAICLDGEWAIAKDEHNTGVVRTGFEGQYKVQRRCECQEFYRRLFLCITAWSGTGSSF